MKSTYKNTMIAILIIDFIFIITMILQRENFNYAYLAKVFVISVLNFNILLRVMDSYSILNRIRKLEEVKFPKYKDISIVLIGLMILITTYLFLFLDYFKVIDVFQPLGEVSVIYKPIILISFAIFLALVLLSNLSGVIVRPYFSDNVEIFEVKEHNVILGNEFLNRATGSFKSGVIIGYYIFNFEDIKGKYKDEFGNVVISGYKDNPFKVIISAPKSKSYFSQIILAPKKSCLYKNL